MPLIEGYEDQARTIKAVGRFDANENLMTAPGTGATTPAVAAGEAHIGEVGGNMVRVAVEFTRPADTTDYAIGDVVSNNTTTTTPMTFANFARVSGGTGYITGARLETDKKSIVPAFRVHLFNAAPTVAADNAAWKELYADASKLIGSFDFAAMATGADTTNSTMSKTENMGLRIPFIAVASRSILAVLETLTVFSPANAQKFLLTLWGDLN